MRDDFIQKVKETLAKRVGFRCSNPNCRTLTSGPHANEEKAVNVGVAAHITAASIKGPRHDPGLTAKQRKSPKNGIWLCQTCAKLVDSDLDRYSGELLLSWKENAEHETSTALHRQTFPVEANTPAINFTVADWKLSAVQGNSPSDFLYVVSCWANGDVRYSCTIRLRNNQQHENVLHHLRIEFQRGNEVIHSDEAAFPSDEIVLAPTRWFRLDVDHGLHGRSVLLKSETVWFAAEIVGEDEVQRWKVAAIRHGELTS